MDALEKDRLRRKMAIRMKAFQGAGEIDCVSGHWYAQAQPCDLCERKHANELLVVKNSKGRKYKLGAKCLAEMVKFQVIGDVGGLSKWLSRMPDLKREAAERDKERLLEQEAERKKHQKKVIVRRRKDPESSLS